LTQIGDRKSPSTSRSAPVLPFTTQIKRKQIPLTPGIASDEGFKILKKESANQEEKPDSQSGLTSKLPKNVRKIFGDDDV
jgi:hypothetical protein